MGYRSDVRIVTSKRGFKELIQSIDEYYKKNNISKSEQYSLLNRLDVNCENKFQKYFGWNDIKWYSYPAVEAIEDGLQTLAEKDLSFRFARLGENNEDYEEYCYDSDNDKEPDLEWPALIRRFDDEEVIENIKAQDTKSKEEAER